jgi:phage shock protein PspC (stress-responsive transcriptional regulator)
MSTDSDAQQSSTQETGSRPGRRTRPPLRRAAHGRMLAGVAAGLARYFGVDVTIIRIVLVALAFLGIIGSSLAIGGFPLYLAGIPLYLACWVLIPEDGAEHSIASHLLRSTQDHRAS